jgi:hypothetical protein
VKFIKPFALILLTALILSACGATSVSPTSSATIESAPTDMPATIQSAAQPAPQATSRGNELEASDPASVKLGAGRPALVEFFRFT